MRELRSRPVLVVALVVAAVLGAAALADAVGWAQPASGGASAVGTATVRVGEPAPDLVLVDTAGQQRRLSDLRGHPVWLAFGATWCAPCRAEAPDIETAYRDAGAGSGAQVLAVYKGDGAETVTDFAARLSLTYPQVPDPQSAAADRFGVFGIPTHIFIDARGVVTGVKVGALGAPEARSLLAQAGAAAFPAP